jgi:hypothetical protein
MPISLSAARSDVGKENSAITRAAQAHGPKLSVGGVAAVKSPDVVGAGALGSGSQQGRCMRLTENPALG